MERMGRYNHCCGHSQPVGFHTLFYSIFCLRIDQCGMAEGVFTQKRLHFERNWLSLPIKLVSGSQIC